MSTGDAAQAASGHDRGAAVALERVRVVYETADGPIRALDPVSMGLTPGEFVSVIGPSGCGKSTLLKVVAGLLGPSDGEVTVDGHLLRGPYPGMGIVFQEAVLLDWRTVIDNVLLQADVRRLDRAKFEPRARELLAKVGLRDFERKRPYELSGGMRQRTAICRALVHDPALLLMDEPFGALDALTRETMNEELQRLWMDLGMTVLFVTHSIPEAVLLSDRVTVMSPRPGRILADFVIDLPRPREVRQLQDMPAFLEYVSKIRRVLDSGIAATPSGVPVGDQ